MSVAISSRRVTNVCAMILLTACISANARADVQFDVPATVAAHPTESSETSAGLYTVEAHFRTSLLQYRGKSDHVTEALYRVESIHADWRVTDFAPKTRTQTKIVGNVQVEQSTGKKQQLGLTLGWHDIVQANTNASHGTNESETRRFETLPPSETVSASGTISRGSGVYFKLRPAPDTPLEGAHTFVLQLEVPVGWRASHARVICQAKTKSGQILQQSFSVPVYLAGDEQAQAAATDLSRTERALMQVAAKERNQVQRCSRPTLAHELSISQPRIPENWLTLVMRGSPGPQSFERHLPDTVRDAVQAYRQSKQQLQQLTATPKANLTANL